MQPARSADEIQLHGLEPKESSPSLNSFETETVDALGRTSVGSEELGLNNSVSGNLLSPLEGPMADAGAVIQLSRTRMCYFIS